MDPASLLVTPYCTMGHPKSLLELKLFRDKTEETKTSNRSIGDKNCSEAFWDARRQTFPPVHSSDLQRQNYPARLCVCTLKLFKRRASYLEKLRVCLRWARDRQKLWGFPGFCQDLSRLTHSPVTEAGRFASSQPTLLRYTCIILLIYLENSVGAEHLRFWLSL